MRSAVQSCVPLQESTAKRCAFFVYIPAGHPKGAGPWRNWTRELALVGRKRQGTYRARSDRWPAGSATQNSTRFPHQLSWVQCDRTKGLEGALRATETSCVPLLENLKFCLVFSHFHKGDFRRPQRARFKHHAKHISKQNVAKMVISIQPFQQHSTHQ